MDIFAGLKMNVLNSTDKLCLPNLMLTLTVIIYSQSQNIPF